MYMYIYIYIPYNYIIYPIFIDYSYIPMIHFSSRKRLGSGGRGAAGERAVSLRGEESEDRLLSLVRRTGTGR